MLPLILAAALGLSACSALDPDSQSSEPVPVRSPAPVFDPDGTNFGPASARVVDPGWDTAVQEADGMFLSMHEDEDGLDFLAVDSQGEIAWSAQRPRVCSGFLVTAAEDGPVAVLMDQASPSGGSLTTTATGYDLVTGNERWGPVETPGPLLGNGLVFAGPPKDFIGAGGSRTALDPATGNTLAVEDDGTSDDAVKDGSAQVIALLGDHLVRSQGTSIIGEDLHGHRLWTRESADFGMSVSQARETPWEPIGTSHAIVGEADSEARILLDLDSGATVASDIEDAGFDSSSNTLVTIGSDLRGLDDDGTKRWSTPLSDEAEVAAVGAGLIVFDSGTGSRSARDGSLVKNDPAALKATEQFGPPHHISKTGAALIGDPQSPLLVTNQN